jgi:hypothetical protein
MSQHWYLQDGTPFYTIKSKNGSGLRDVTIKDAKKVKALYSVTTIIGQLNKPKLENWKLNQLLEAVLKTSDTVDFKQDFWKSKVWEVYTDLTSQYSKKGNAIHNKLEEYFKNGIVNDEDSGFILPVSELVNSLGFDLLEPEQSFACGQGFGGKIDLILESVENNKKAIIYFKTKQGVDLGPQLLYNDYLMQLAAYREAIDKEADCYNLLISATHPGIVYLHKWTEEELQRGWKMFKHLLEYTKIVKNYDPSF